MLFRSYWKNRVRPYWQDVWPKSRDLATPGIAESLARLSIAAGAEFPVALAAIEDWLRPIEHPFYVLHRMHESGLCTRFPSDSLRLMSAVINEEPWAAPALGHCLDSIVNAAPQLAQDADYQRLREYFRKRAA